MKKLINLLKKPLLIIFAALFFISTIGLVVITCLPHGNKYSISYNGQKIEYIFDDDDELIIETTTDESFEVNEYDCRIKNGILYIKEPLETEYYKIGKINAYKIDVGEGLAMKCALTKGLTITTIIFMCLFGLATIGCVVVLILDKKGIIKIKEQAKVEEVKEPVTNAETSSQTEHEEVADDATEASEETTELE